jgi:CheY-like chemotaxis protein
MSSNLENFHAGVWTGRRVPVSGTPLRVLIVDDNRTAGEALAAYLSGEDMECRLALGGIQAIDIGISWRPDVIIMDISMPRPDGIEAARALRHDHRSADIAIIAFTALDKSEVLRHQSQARFDGYCQKGQPPVVLLTLIGNFLDKV